MDIVTRNILKSVNLNIEDIKNGKLTEEFFKRRDVSKADKDVLKKLMVKQS